MLGQRKIGLKNKAHFVNTTTKASQDELAHNQLFNMIRLDYSQI